MGCAGTKNSKPTVEAGRRRLSIGAVDKDVVGNAPEVAPEEDRGLLGTLSQQTIVEMLSSSENDRKFSIGSKTDQGKTSFANKTVEALGTKNSTSEFGLGYTCRKGLKPECPNQDSWMVLKTDTEEAKFSIYGVFDGHGQKGHEVSNFVKENLPKLLIRDQRFGHGKGKEMQVVCTDAFKKIQSLISSQSQMGKLDAKLSGTTATMVIHVHDESKLVVSHVADSTAVMGRWNAGKLQGKVLTRDHKPELPDERARIEKAGGRVVFDGYANHRIYAKNARYPGLNMSRCLGDLMGHADCGISCQPEVNEYPVTSEDHILLVCSDGVWEFIEADEAVNFVNNFPPAKAMIAAEKLAKEAWDRWIREEGGAVVDDITVVLVYLQSQQNKPEI